MPTKNTYCRLFNKMLTLCTGPLVLLATLLFSLTANAAQITVLDSDGLPLKDAVVEVYYDAETNPPEQEKENIYQRNAAFHPKVLTVPIGSYVAFPNQDTTRHHVYSFSSAKTFDLNLYLQETPPPVHFDQAGIVVLGCNIHDHMQAFIVVSDAPYAATTNAEGMLALPTLPPGQHRLRVWHPRLDNNQEIWWEGDINNADQLEVRLELNALPPPVQNLSPLQQRFRDAS
ncbi:Cupredoxin [Vreelandella sp. V005]|uniref:Cupredoxin n=1 Tax=Vreelandella sp. V005 TaxID=3459608 RepID=UPI0040447D9A